MKIHDIAILDVSTRNNEFVDLVIEMKRLSVPEYYVAAIMKESCH